MPKQPLAFTNGKSLVMEEKNIGNFERLLRSSWVVAVPFSFLLSCNLTDLVLNAIASLLPFYFYHTNLHYTSKLCIRKLYLDEDGENIWVQMYLSKTLHKVNISQMKFDEENKFKRIDPFIKVLVINPQITAFISKSSEIYYEDVLDKILECEKIQVDSLSK
jgi:hypothetical protein